jgi:hypothetical protein
VGEATIGRGYGDMFPLWTGNLPTNPAGANMDAGFGGQDSQGNFRLLEMRSYRVQALYHFSEPSRAWIEAGYGQVYSTNANLFTPTRGVTVYSRQEGWFGNLFHDFTPQLRAAFRYAYFSTSYANNDMNHDHRIGLSVWFSF